MKIYSACNFFNELDLLELRLETLNPLVDYFIICESIKTHSNLPKPLYYQENKDRYKKFQDKIIHIVIDDSPNVYEDFFNMKPKNDLHDKIIENSKKADWLNPISDINFIRDNYEKECMQLGLENASSDDIIALGDLDEIPRPETLSNILNSFDLNVNYLLKQGSYHYFVNLEKTNEEWVGMNVLSVGKLLNDSVGNIKAHQNVLGKRVEFGGWHFSYMNGADSIIKKLESFSHQEFNNDYIKNNVNYIINNCTTLGIDLLGRPSKWSIRNINDGTFPEYLVENQEKFAKYILR
jgi:beta-1,4-mannosyl-glycoprotein beta-1,4-N-acetylglucosaminyltransferase